MSNNEDLPEKIYVSPHQPYQWQHEPKNNSSEQKDGVCYYRADKVEEYLQRRARLAHNAINKAKEHGMYMLECAQKLERECSPESIESERKANEELTNRIVELEAELQETRARTLEDADVRDVTHEYED